MRKWVVATIGLTLAIAAAHPAAAQCDLTIPTAVDRARPGPLVISRISEMMVIPVDQAIREADLITVGSLKRQTVYLSPDKCTLYTDYVVSTSRIVASSRDSATALPGPAPAIVVRSWGGETTIGGVTVKVYDANMRALSEGQKYLLFLRFNPELGKYEICDHGAYALEVGADNRARPLVKDEGLIDSAIANVDVETAVQAVQARMKQQ